VNGEIYMSQLTRKAIMKCTLELAEKKSLKKITVKDIADECGITRRP
jgi:AcrR family transcriptional regulator